MAEQDNSAGGDSVTESLPWVTGQVVTPVGLVPRVATRWSWRDRLGALAVCWNIGRQSYRVAPGLYAVGDPTAESPLLVSANYKLSFDTLRKAVDGLDVWILVLDTQGINVWCAAGKGTFGTGELIQRMEVASVAKVASGSTLILPQLGAPGMAVPEVRRKTGHRVVYGPVRASDIPAFLRDGLQATPAMRRVSFTLSERLAVVPVELAQRFVPTLLIMLALILATGGWPQGFRLVPNQWSGIAVAVWSNYIAGLLLVPALLPWLPGRAFALKGAWVGLVTGGALWMLGRHGLVDGLALGLISTAACSFLGLTFTGSTPYTSASGVRRELQWTIPAQAGIAVAGLGLWFFSAWRQGVS